MTSLALSRFLRVLAIAVVAMIMAHGAARASTLACGPAAAEHHVHSASDHDDLVGGADQAADHLPCCSSAPCGVAMLTAAAPGFQKPSPDPIVTVLASLQEAPTGRVERPPITV